MIAGCDVVDGFAPFIEIQRDKGHLLCDLERDSLWISYRQALTTLIVTRNSAKGI